MDKVMDKVIDNGYIMEYFSFKTWNKNDFIIDDILYLEKSVNRLESRDIINSFVNDYYIAQQIEYGIFEFVLTQIKHLNVIPKILPNMYNKKLNEICENLDINNNQTLLPKILNGFIEPFTIAFFAPHEIHPEKWKKQIEKQIQTRKLIDDIPTTDLYGCYTCGARKSTVRQIQIRCADEPMTLFITCTVCHNTYTKNG